MPLAQTGAGAWGVVLPLAETNLATNPSFENGTAGVVAIQAATLGTSSQYQQFGVWSLQVTPNSNGTSGAKLGTFTTGNGTAYAVSVFARVEAGVPMRLGIGDSAGVNLTSGTVTFTGGGTWAWYSCGTVEAAQGTRSVVIQKTSGNSVLPFYVDGVKISPWSDGTSRQTTYFDGDFGGTWTGAANASASTRSGQDRSGGTIVALADLGFHVKGAPGAGMPPIENSFQSYAVIDGAQFQRSRAAQRGFTLISEAVSGTTMQDYHITRDRLIDAFKPDAATPQQPTRFYYVGGPGTVQIDAYYDSGLEEGNRDGPMAETMPLRFVAADPYWYAPTHQGTTLVSRVSIGSTNFLARRSPLGAWGTMGQNNGTTIRNPPTSTLRVNTTAINASGTLFFGGNWGTLVGTVSPHIGMYFPATNTFGSLTGGTLTAGEGPVYALAQNPNGTLYIGGFFTNAAGTVVNGLTQWTGAYGTLTGGTVAAFAIVYALKYTPTGTLFIGGGVSSFAGSANSANAAMWANGAFGTLGGTVNSSVFDLAWGLDQTLYLGGQFTIVNNVFGSYIARWKNGTLGTMYSFNNPVNAFGVAPNGLLYEGGQFDVVTGAGSALKAANWNGVQHAALGAGLGGGFGVQEIVVNQTTGAALFVGQFSGYGSVDIGGTAQYAVWNGASWLPPDIRISSIGYAYTSCYGDDGALYLGGEFFGTAQAASVGTIVNSAPSAAYPTLRVRNRGTSAASLYQLLNVTTGAGIYFNLAILGGEEVVLNLQPGNRSFQSNFRGNVFGGIIPGSNLTAFNLVPGTNYVSYFCDSGSVETALFWPARLWSSDGGTVY